MPYLPFKPLLQACILSLMLAICTPVSADAPAKPDVRLAVVNIADDILIPLAADFEAHTGLTAKIVYAGSNPFAVAEAGDVDLVVSHFGHPLAQGFVEKGAGLYPKTVFANQAVILGPPADPAGIRNMRDAAAAIKRIASSGAKLHTNGHGANDLLDILSLSAGVDQDGWVIRSELSGKAAIDSAAKAGAYIIWGLPPFLRHQKSWAGALEILGSDDPIFQRIMVSMPANPEKIPGANLKAARQFEQYLLSARAQARIRDFRYRGLEKQAWWPAGRHNSPAD